MAAVAMPAAIADEIILRVDKNLPVVHPGDSEHLLKLKRRYLANAV
jgi:hypothetical protein